MKTEDHTIRFRDRSVAWAFCVVGLSSIFFAIKASRDQRELETLREQHSVLATKLEKLNKSLTSIRQHTGTVESFTQAEKAVVTDSLRLVGYKQPTIEKSFPEGSTENLFASIFYRRGGDLGENLGQETSELERFALMLEKIESVNKAAETIEGRLTSLAKILRHRRQLLKNVPSLVPVEGYVSSEFGPRLAPFEGKRQLHLGIDLVATEGTKIIAPADGLVAFTGSFDTLGTSVVINHGEGLMTRYGHISRILVKKGQKVRRGQTIALVGSTGQSTGPHLHYEVWVNNEAVNPRDFFFDLTSFAAIQPQPSASKSSKKGLAVGGRPKAGIGGAE